MPSLPPRYSSLEGVLYPPRYSPHRHRRAQHSFEYGESWCTLKIFSRSSSTSGPAKLPKFTSRDPIQGCLDLNLDSPQNISSISLSLIGKIVTASYEGGSCSFLDYPIIKWTRAHGDPRTVILNPTPSSSSSSIETSKRFDGKLSGQYLWPFSFPFPSQILLDDRKTYPAPQTFLQRGESTTVQYSLVLKITHGVLRADSKLKADIVYVPEIIPPPTSLLRQVADNHGVKIPGPGADPLGWHELKPVHIFDKLSNGRPSKLQCTLSLAKPLIYTRGTIIPINLVLRSSNHEMLNADRIIIRLTRRLKCFANSTSTSLSLFSHHGSHHHTGSNPWAKKTTTGSRTEETTSVIGQIVWQPQDSSADDDSRPSGSSTRCFNGEIHLPKEMQPSCEFKLFNISYAVELLPFSHLTMPEILLSYPVTIATQHRADSPMPVLSTVRQPRTAPGPNNSRR